MSKFDDIRRSSDEKISSELARAEATRLALEADQKKTAELQASIVLRKRLHTEIVNEWSDSHLKNPQSAIDTMEERLEFLLDTFDFGKFCASVIEMHGNESFEVSTRIEPKRGWFTKYAPPATLTNSGSITLKDFMTDAAIRSPAPGIHFRIDCLSEVEDTSVVHLMDGRIIRNAGGLIKAYEILLPYIEGAKDPSNFRERLEKFVEHILNLREQIKQSFSAKVIWKLDKSYDDGFFLCMDKFNIFIPNPRDVGSMMQFADRYLYDTINLKLEYAERRHRVQSNCERRRSDEIARRRAEYNNYSSTPTWGR